MATSKDMGKRSVDPTAGVKHGGPDADSKAAKATDPQLNAQRGRDAAAAGARGSNHVGQGSDGATNLSETSSSASSASAKKVRKGNSAEDSSDKDQNQEMEMKLDDGSSNQPESKVKLEAKKPGLS